jgi:very-short-patch-repair endonuclease
MEFARKNADLLVDMYVNRNMSTYQIAEAFNTYANKIRLALKFLGVELRDYKNAQKMALDSGRAEHPTKGKTLTEEHKKNVGRGRSKAWERMSDEERERVSQISKQQWLAMSEEEKARLFKLAAEAVRESSREGSQTEKFVVESLRKSGYTVQFHVKGLIPNSNLELDMFLPELRTVIEIDGPAHFLPIWGEEKLQKHQRADAEKQGLLNNAGYVLIRVKQIDKSMSVTKMEQVFVTVLEEVKKIEDKFPPQSKRLIEIEVKNGQVSK